MPPKTLTRDQSRQVDRRAMDEYGISGLVLMENAGRGVTDVLCEKGVDGPVVICCGKGNNAGDGFVIARHLDLRGFDARVLLGTWTCGASTRGCCSGPSPRNWSVTRRPTSASWKRPTCRSRSLPASTMRLGSSGNWPAPGGSSTAYWARAPEVNPGRRWTR